MSKKNAVTGDETQPDKPVPLAEPEGGWPADEFTGVGGSYERDPFTGVRSRVAPEAPEVRAAG